MIACTNDGLTLRNVTFTYGNINQLNSYQGRVDICVNGTYIPICDLGWDNVDAQLVCRKIYGSRFGK